MSVVEHASATIGAAGSSQDQIQRLPVELQVWIFEFLDYLSALRLSQTGHHYHTLVQPASCAPDEKEAFVKAAQHWPKHSQCFMRSRSPPAEGSRRYKDARSVVAVSKAADFGLACYACCRVRSLDSFARTQVRKSRSKFSVKDGTAGHKRFCIDCGILRGVYRQGIEINRSFEVSYSQRSSAITYVGRRVFEGAMCLCLECKNVCLFSVYVPESGKVGHYCDICEAYVATGKEALNTPAGHSQVLFTCKGCQRTGPEMTQDGCVFCRKPACVYCGSLYGSGGRWWCGLACSKRGLEFALDDAPCLYSPGSSQLRLTGEVYQKRALRDDWNESDLFETEETDLLAGLSLHDDE